MSDESNAHSVCSSRIRHGVTSISVCDVFVDQRTLAFRAPLLAVLDGSLHRKDVHAVDLETRDILTPLVVIGKSGSTVSSCTHSVLVV